MTHTKTKQQTPTGDATIASFILLCSAIFAHVIGIENPLLSPENFRLDDLQKFITSALPIGLCILSILFMIDGLIKRKRTKETRGYLWFPIMFCNTVSDILFIWCIRNDIPITVEAIMELIQKIRNLL